MRPRGYVTNTVRMEPSATMIRTLIVDDETVARRGLRGLLEQEPSLKVVGECRTGQEAVGAIRDLKPDLVFMDIQIPGMDGFEVLQAHGVEPAPAVIFVTAYDDYALDAFDIQAVDYLLKPFSNARLKEAVRRAARQLESHRVIQRLNRQIDALMKRVDDRNAIASRQAPLTRIPVKEAGRVVFVQSEEVDWIEAADNYVCLHVGKKTHLLRQTMSEMERRLDSRRFMRIHRSRIVNIDRIREVHPQSSGDSIILLEDGTELTSSRTYSQKRRQMLSPLYS